jgi:glycosyltransferase involved in cell wall biosynthesis
MSDYFNNEEFPMVSICTPTFNRRPFIPSLIECVVNQTYPANRMEWIIVDDGPDPVGDLFANVPIARYVRYPEKMTLGKKRNITNDLCTGNIIIYMDDDDYYPPTRVSHAVETLRNTPDCLIAGCLKLPIYSHASGNVYLSGPYGVNRITAATFAFRRELFEQTRFCETDCISEEREFLKDYTIPSVELDPVKTILVMSHSQNTIDKEDILSKSNTYITKSLLTASDFIQHPTLFDFYIIKLPDLLAAYEYGSVKHKHEEVLCMKDVQIKRLYTKLRQVVMENDRLKTLNENLKKMAFTAITNKNNK